MNNLNTPKYLIQINFQKILKARWFHGKILPRTCKQIKNNFGAQKTIIVFWKIWIYAPFEVVLVN